LGSGFRNRTSAYLGPSPETVGPEYLLLRPSTDGGDLVLPHAIGVHGLVLLAVPSVLLAGTATPPARQLRVIAVAVASVVAALAILLTQAFRHLPLEQLHPLALAALGVCAGALLAAYAGIAAALLKEEPTHEPATA
jgi:formate-dependent nitrite reductase membrane component NrfD